MSKPPVEVSVITAIAGIFLVLWVCFFLKGCAEDSGEAAPGGHWNFTESKSADFGPGKETL